MIDPKRIRQNPEEFQRLLNRRNLSLSVDAFLHQDEKRRQLLNEAEEKKALRNNAGKLIGLARKKGADDQQIEALMADAQCLSQEIEQLDADIAAISTQIDEFLLSLPNLPHPEVPDDESQQLRLTGEPRRFLWEPKSYQEIGTDLHLTVKLPARDAPVSCGLGARLERSLTSFFLDQLSGNGFKELITHSKAEAVSIYQNDILTADQLPLRHCSTGIGSIQLLGLSEMEHSYDDLTVLIASIERLLSLLKLPCRILMLSAQKLDFIAAMTICIEVWAPSLQQYVPAARFTNHEDFIARREAIRCRVQAREKPRYLHTLSGTVDIAGCIVQSILENHQNEDGSVEVPEALVPYMGCQIIR